MPDTGHTMGEAKEASSSDGLNALLGFGVIALMFYFFVIDPVHVYLRVREARNWPAVPCEAVSSRVTEGPYVEDLGQTYNVYIGYKYVYRGVGYESKRYGLTNDSHRSRFSRKRAEAITSRYNSGHRTVCYVNPKNPQEAVLERGFMANLSIHVIGAWIGFLLLAVELAVVLLFVLVGHRKTSEALERGLGQEPLYATK